MKNNDHRSKVDVNLKLLCWLAGIKTTCWRWAAVRWSSLYKKRCASVMGKGRARQSRQ